ncbi:MAG: hypothetical protein HYV26_13740 [Candidatus Hydrogenedentes bacterium]|nr:hypothetical protein [Candidatus Hydrogenedentota bacterium]
MDRGRLSPGAEGEGWCSMNGVELKTQAFMLHEALRESHLLRARRALLEYALVHGTVTADHVRAAVKLPQGFNPKVFGPVPSPLARAGIIRRACYANSQRVERHAAPISVWELRDRNAALEWLERHPPPKEIFPEQLEIFPKNETAGGYRRHSED